jgi:putative SOS response-associated peptidase YedK
LSAGDGAGVFAQRRWLMLADSFYEWIATGAKQKGHT